MNEKQYHVPKKVHLEYLVSVSIFELNFKLASKSLRNSYRSPCTNKRNTHTHIKKQSAHILASSSCHTLDMNWTYIRRSKNVMDVF